MDRGIKEKLRKSFNLIWLDSLFRNFDGDNVALEIKIGLIDKKIGLFK